MPALAERPSVLRRQALERRRTSERLHRLQARRAGPISKIDFDPRDPLGSLNSLAEAQIEFGRPTMITQEEVDAFPETIDRKAIVAGLQEGVTEENLYYAVHLAEATEGGTNLYAGEFTDCADKNGAPWLRKFTELLWKPDEEMHKFAPRMLLMKVFGATEADLVARQKKVLATDFVLKGGHKPVQLTAYASVQEYLTDNWHGLIAKLIRPGSPEGARPMNRVKARETLHNGMFVDLTALQLAFNPELLYEVVQALIDFEMPGGQLDGGVQELEAKVPEILYATKANFDDINKDIIKMQQAFVANDVRALGRLGIEYKTQGRTVGPFSLEDLKRAFFLMGAPGAGLLGEAILKRVGLGVLSENSKSPMRRARRFLRDHIAEHIDIDFRPPELIALQKANTLAVA